MFINTISASKSDIISQCLWRYNLKYIIKLKGIESPNKESLNFGSFIHKIFELGYKEKDIKILSKIAEQEKPTYKIPFRENDRTKICIENFLNWNQHLGNTIFTEFSYKVPMDEKNDIHHNGVIDRVIEGSDGGYLVIDYKTSKREKKRKDLLDDNQLKGYAYAISVICKVPIKNITCAHYYPLSNNFIPVKFTQFQIDLWKRKEIEKVWRIRKKKKEDFFPQKNIFCDYCEFKECHCTAFSPEELVQRRLDEYKLASKDNSLEGDVEQSTENSETDKRG